MKSTAIAETTASTNLVTISQNEIAGELVQSVNARDLHGKLGSKRQFGNWIKDKIEKYGFIEKEDFNKIVKPQQNNKTDYILTLDTAKEIAMVENNEMGRKIRRYFIEVEKKVREKESKQNQILPGVSNKDVKTVLEKLTTNNEELINENKRLNQYYNQQEKIKKISQKFSNDFGQAMVRIAEGHLEREKLIKQQEQEIKELKANNNKHKALQTNISQLGQAELLMSVEEAGVKLGIARNTLFRKMRAKKFLKLNNEPYKRFKGDYFVQKKVKHKTSGGNMTQYMQTFILPKGLELLQKTFA